MEIIIVIDQWIIQYANANIHKYQDFILIPPTVRMVPIVPLRCNENDAITLISYHLADFLWSSECLKV